jgi:hypothetical protein
MVVAVHPGDLQPKWKLPIPAACLERWDPAALFLLCLIFNPRGPLSALAKPFLPPLLSVRV